MIMARPLVRRSQLVDRVASGLAEGVPVVVSGVRGAGRTTVLDALAGSAAADGRRVIRMRPGEGNVATEYGALTELLAALEPAARELAPGPRRSAVEAVLRLAPLPERGWDEIAIRLALVELLERSGPALLLVDDAQCFDPGSARVLAQVIRGPSCGMVKTVVAQRGVAGLEAARQLCGAQAALCEVGPFDVDQLAEMLVQAGLPARWAAGLHTLSGGNPGLARAAARTLQPTRPELPSPLPPEVVRAAAPWLADVPAQVHGTLLTAALASRPTAELLRRAGHPDAGAHLAAAIEAGLVTIGPDGVVTLSGSLLRAALEAGADTEQRFAAHRALARAVVDPVEEVRHRAMADDSFDQRIADEVAAAAEAARRSGERALAAELHLLGARRTPPDGRATRLDRLSAAAADATAAGRVDLAREVVQAVRVCRGGPAEQVAALLAVVDAGGQAMEELSQTLAQAMGAARSNPALLAAVELRYAIKANVVEGRPRAARAAATRAAELGRRGGDRVVEAMALTEQARMERLLGDPAAESTLKRAVALQVPVAELGVRNSPQYLAVRHAIFDDRLDQARTALMELLAVAEREGDAEDLAEVLRSLVEVDTRGGRCARAVDWSEREIAVLANTGLSFGPVWYIAALAQTAGGDFAQAQDYAHRGTRESEQDHDLVFLSRNLLALGTVQLLTGDAQQAAQTLERVAALESEQQVADPRVLRWQPELIEAWAATGRLDQAQELAERAHHVAAEHPKSGLVPALWRAAAHCAAQRGDADAAVAMLRRAGDRFGELGLPLEQGRALVALGRVERARRRTAAARSAWQDAAAIFNAAQARPWAGLTADLLGRLEGPHSARLGASAALLTDAERRLAELVAQGASNQEAAGRLFISVKTVEAMLSRVYRKLGIRSRTQLAAALRS